MFKSQIKFMMQTSEKYSITKFVLLAAEICHAKINVQST